MKQLLVLCATMAATAQVPVQQFTGTLSGLLTGDDGTALRGGSIVLRLATKSVPKLRRQTTIWTAITGAGGAFQFQALPEGNYTVCASVPDSTWLNPCEWNFLTPTATVTPQAPAARMNITLKRGATIPIRIDDSGQLLAQNEGKTPGAGFLLGVSSLEPGSFFRLVPLVSQDSGGRNHQIVIPYNTSLTLLVHPTFYHLTDGAGAALTQSATTRIPLLVVPGQQVSPIKFTIAGGGK